MDFVNQQQLQARFGGSKNMLTQEMITSQYSDPAEQSAAATAYSLGLEWVEQQPKSWCVSKDKHSRRDARRADRQRKREQAKAMYDHIYARMVLSESDVTAEGYHVVGFGFIVMAILSALISWVVQQILNHYWSESN